MLYLRRITLKFFIFFAIVTGAITVGGHEISAFAQSPEVESAKLSAELSVNIHLEDESLNFSLKLENDAKEKVYNDYSFPNLWAAESLEAARNASRSYEISLDKQNILLRFDPPIKPGETEQFDLDFKISVPTQDDFRYFKANELPEENLNSEEQVTSLNGYRISYPISWQQPTYSNFASTDISGEKLISLENFAEVELVWGTSLVGIVKLTQNPDALQFVATQDKTQTIAFLNNSETLQNIEAIFKDDYYNVYVEASRASELQLEREMNNTDGPRFDFSAVETSDFLADETLEQAEQILRKASGQGLEADIFLLDQNFLGKGEQLVLRVCDQTPSCSYYSLASAKQISGAGILVANLENSSELLRGKLRQSLPTNSLADSTSVVELSAQENPSQNQPEIEIDFPEEIEAFSNFSAEVRVINPSNRAIFLDELRIGNNTFPIIDSSLGGLHEGVLPNSEKSLEVDELFLSRLVLGASSSATFDSTLVYSIGVSELEAKSEHSVLLKQNYVFLGVLAIALGSFALSAWIIAHLYSRNKYLFMGAYWQSRRLIEDAKWFLSKRI